MRTAGSVEILIGGIKGPHLDVVRDGNRYTVMDVPQEACLYDGPSYVRMMDAINRWIDEQRIIMNGFEAFGMKTELVRRGI